MDEFALISRYFASVGHHQGVELGVGDDAAIIAPRPDEAWVVATDTLVAGVHFPELEPADAIAYRAVAVNVSDMAAMAAQPRYCTLALTMPTADLEWINAFAQGLRDAVTASDLALVGGDTTRGPLTVSLTVIGSGLSSALLRRSGAAVGHEILVSGCLGDAAAGLAALLDGRSPSVERERLIQRFRRPPSRVALAIDNAAFIGAAIDVSDGLLADAAHIAAASNVAINIDTERVPLSADLIASSGPDQALSHALTGGDDYELLISAPSRAVPQLQRAGFFAIGQCIAGTGVLVDGAPATGHRGYRHFDNAAG
ncbi:MAG: thiamine-phosphate kinase [Pseudomonadota bacterium]